VTCRPETELAVLRWLAFSDHVGESSKTIATAVLGQTLARRGPDYMPTPLDAGDFNRCRLLVEEVPECWAGVEALAEQNAKWRALRDEWHRIAGMLRAGKVAEAGKVVRRAVGAELPADGNGEVVR